jgi:hypothetical protein
MELLLKNKSFQPVQYLPETAVKRIQALITIEEEF